jgi:hypothetical protein
MTENNQEGQGQNEKAFKNFGKRVDEFLVEFEEAGERLKKEFEGKFEELRVSAEKLKKEAESNDRWKDVEQSLKRAGDELGNAFKAAFNSNKKS